MAVEPHDFSRGRSQGKPLDDAFRLESEIGREIFDHEDAVEGPKAFMNDTEPPFRPDS